jgi:hypothetical protein
LIAWYEQEIAAEGDPVTAKNQGLLAALRREREQLVRAAKVAIDAGVAEKEIQLVAEQGRLLAAALLATMADLGMSPTQELRARKVIGAKLREVTAGDEIFDI